MDDTVPADPDGAAHCTGCGEPLTTCRGCGRELDPPRFCGRCGTRLTVRVSPGGWRARCKQHGDLV